MKIAATYDNGMIFQHFGKSRYFKMYITDDDKNIIAFEIVSSNGKGHGELADMLAQYGVNVLICGGIGQGALDSLNEKGIEVYSGNAGNPDGVVITFLAGKLPKQAVNCDHHHNEGHTCGSSHCH